MWTLLSDRRIRPLKVLISLLSSLHNRNTTLPEKLFSLYLLTTCPLTIRQETKYPTLPYPPYPPFHLYKIDFKISRTHQCEDSSCTSNHEITIHSQLDRIPIIPLPCFTTSLFHDESLLYDARLRSGRERRVSQSGIVFESSGSHATPRQCKTSHRV